MQRCFLATHFKVVNIDEGKFYKPCSCVEKFCENKTSLSVYDMPADYIAYDPINLHDLVAARRQVGPSSNEQEQELLREYFNKEKNILKSAVSQTQNSDVFASGLRIGKLCLAMCLIVCIFIFIGIVIFLISRRADKINYRHGPSKYQ